VITSATASELAEYNQPRKWQLTGIRCLVRFCLAT